MNTEKQYLLTLKEGHLIKSQVIKNATPALSIVRNLYVAAGMEETMADLYAIRAFNRIEPGKPVGIENTRNGLDLIIQEHRGEEATA